MADIKSLPDHILIEIFQDLSPKMIKTCCLVFKSWNEIIANSTSLMEKFRLNLYWTDEIAAKIIRKKYQSAIVQDLERDSLDIICSLNLKSLDLSYANFKVSSLIEAMNKLPALKVLVAKRVKITYDISRAEDLKKTWTSLKELRCSADLIPGLSYTNFTTLSLNETLKNFLSKKGKIYNDVLSAKYFKQIRTNLKELRCGANLIPIFDCCTLEILELDLIHKSVNYDSKVMIDFLSQQNDLQELELKIKQADDLFSSKEVFELKFSLKTLKIYCKRLFLHYQEFIRFLQRHQHSLINLDLFFYTEPQFGIDVIHSYVIENLRNLKHLKLGHYEYSLENNKISFRDLTPEKHTAMNIESLNFYADYELEETKRFFELLPNLKRLTFEGSDAVMDAQLLHHINQTNTKLEVLNLSLETDNNLSDLYFPNLKELSVDDIWDKKVLCDFINRHSRILERIIIVYRSITELIAQEIMNCENLKSLELIIFRKRLPCLKWLRDASSFTITIHIEDRYELIVDQKQSFIFPDDKAFWDQKIKSLNDEAEELSN